jgi:hypothetical protein
MNTSSPKPLCQAPLLWNARFHNTPSQMYSMLKSLSMVNLTLMTTRPMDTSIHSFLMPAQRFFPRMVQLKFKSRVLDSSTLDNVKLFMITELISSTVEATNASNQLLSLTRTLWTQLVSHKTKLNTTQEVVLVLTQCTLMLLFGVTNSLRTRLRFTTMMSQLLEVLTLLNLQLTFNLSFCWLSTSSLTIFTFCRDLPSQSADSQQVVRLLLKMVSLLLIHLHKIEIQVLLTLFIARLQDGHLIMTTLNRLS